ncbi:hypothetical protein HBI78_094990 [Parastagonospora nodorum]|nr:hypothetical protein HBI78_094990 [Parastagonospora nodorum]
MSLSSKHPQPLRCSRVHCKNDLCLSTSDRMKIVTSIALQAFLVILAFATTVLRCWVRVKLGRHRITLPDYLVIVGWFCTVGWFACSVTALRLEHDRPLTGPELLSDSVEYLTTVFVSSYFFDVGLYFPKASLLAFYWWLIPLGFRSLRITIYVATVYMACACGTSLLMNTLIAQPISNNWSVENQKLSLWNSAEALYVNWSLNWSTDILLFVLPFFVLPSLKLRGRQKLALCGIFSLGLITIIISLTRFIKVAFPQGDNFIDDASGNLWCTAEMCTATIVVSLPMLKPLLMRITPLNTSDRSNSAYKNADSRKSNGLPGAARSYGQARLTGDDEVELVLRELRESRKSSLSQARTAIASEWRYDLNLVSRTMDQEDLSGLSQYRASLICDNTCYKRVRTNDCNQL